MLANGRFRPLAHSADGLCQLLPVRLDLPGWRPGVGTRERMILAVSGMAPTSAEKK
jgi:hypothetical protein